MGNGFISDTESNDSERPFRVRGMELIYYLYFLSIYYFLLFVSMFKFNYKVGKAIPSVECQIILRDLERQIDKFEVTDEFGISTFLFMRPSLMTFLRG